MDTDIILSNNNFIKKFDVSFFLFTRKILKMFSIIFYTWLSTMYTWQKESNLILSYYFKSICPF